MLDLIDNLQEALDNINNFQAVSNRSGDAYKKFTKFKDWYCDENKSKFGPGKFIGYQNTTIANYDGKGNGGKTNKALANFFIKIDMTHPDYADLRKKLEAFAKSLDKKLQKNVFRISNNSYDGGIYIPKVVTTRLTDDSHIDEASDQDVDSSDVVEENTDDFEIEVEKARKLGQDALKRKLDSEPNGAPSTNEKTIKVFDRSPYVVAWILLRANGKCECCGWKGFEKIKGGLFLEVHHLKPLAQHGKDKIDNAAGVCPNCHRELHYGTNKNKNEMKKKIYSNLELLKTSTHIIQK